MTPNELRRDLHTQNLTYLLAVLIKEYKDLLDKDVAILNQEADNR